MTVTLTGRVADRDSWSADDCSIAAALGVVGRRASLILLREAFYGANRFDEFLHRGGFTNAVTAARLRELVDAGLLRRQPYQEPGQRQREEYHLTQQGAELFPVLLALSDWGNKWVQSGDGPMRFVHAGCGAELAAEVRCAHGHRVEPDEIEAAAR